METIAKEIGANKFLISGNGAQIYDLENSKILYNKYIEKNKVLNIMKICEENSMYYSIYAENSIITKSLNYNVLYYNYENKAKQPDKKSHINIVENVYDYVSNLDKDVFLKVTVCDSDKIIFNNLIKKLRTIKDIDVLDVEHMSRKVISYGTESLEVTYYYTEITNKNVNKWNAIEFLLKELNIKPEEVIAIGDNANDKEMIEKAGVGVAMGNSAPYIKEIADVIVSDNNSSGVAEALDMLVK